MKQQQLHVQNLKLCNNEIKALHNDSIPILPNLNHVDLRNNLISSLDNMEGLKIINITELLLDGNPICEEYDEISYLKEMRQAFPKLEKLV